MIHIVSVFMNFFSHPHIELSDFWLHGKICYLMKESSLPTAKVSIELGTNFMLVIELWGPVKL